MATDLTRLTVNLVPRAVDALEYAASLTRDSKTDTINRALQVYAFLEKEQAEGSQISLITPDGSMRIVKLL